MARENVIERALSGRTIGGSGCCDQVPGLKGKFGVSQQQLLLALGVFIFTKCGFGTRVKENGATDPPIQFVLRVVVFLRGTSLWVNCSEANSKKH